MRYLWIIPITVWVALVYLIGQDEAYRIKSQHQLDVSACHQGYMPETFCKGVL